MADLSLSGYKLTYDDEFSDAALFKTSSDGKIGYRNSYSHGRSLPSNKEAEYYADPNVGPNPFSVQNGALTITARPTQPGEQTNGLPYTSGIITTENSFAQNQGYFEIRAQTTGTQGFWPAFWMLPEGGAGNPEIDVLEQPNNGGSSQYWTYTNFGDSNKGGGFSDTGQVLSAGYHRYGAMWTATSITYYFDGKQIGQSFTPPADYNSKMFMIANLAVGGDGSWPGRPTGAQSAEYKIDYIRAYSMDPSIPAVAMQPISSPDGVDTRPVLTSTTPAPAPAPAPAPVGSGPDTLVLNMAQDAYQGNAQFTVSIDGAQQGGTFTATASKAAGQIAPITIQGTFGTTPHTVTVNFLNDAYDGSAQTDRNLYLVGAQLNGTALPNSTVSMFRSGPESFSFGAPASSFPTVPLGSGPDKILIGLSQDAYLGDAQFTLSVDGRQIGGTLTTQASHAAGQSQVFALNGTFGPGSHNVSVNFLNDAYGGTAATDRNVYVSSLSYNGVESPTNTAALMSGGAVNLGVSGPQDTITFLLTEDAYQGDAQVALSLDGKLLGTPTITFLNSGGAAQAFTYTGDFGGKGVPHTATVNFLNDAYGGTTTTDRNVYVKNIVFDGVARPELATTLYSAGATNFLLPAS